MSKVISTIIVTYNSGEILLSCLENLTRASQELATEIIVVDNNSTDGTPERIMRHFPDITLVQNISNRGFAAANNQGLAAACGKYMLLLNPDALVEPDTLTRMVEYLEEYPQVGIAGPRMYDGEGHIALTAYPTFSPLMILWQYVGLDRIFPYAIYGRYRRQCEQATEPFAVETVQGSCFWIRREVYEQIGGLEEAFFLFCEEPDYCERARSTGWEVMYLPAAHVTHFESTTVSRYTSARLRSYHLCPLIYFRKRQRSGAVTVLKLGFTFELAGKLAVRLLQIALGRREFGPHAKAYIRILIDIWKH